MNLLAKLEAATEGSRELDAEIIMEICDDAIIGPWPCGESEPVVFHAQAIGIVDKSPVPAYTTSIDAALTLVPEGWALLRINQYHETSNPAWGWGVEMRYYTNPEIGLAIGESRASLPLAICIASLRAREG